MKKSHLISGFLCLSFLFSSAAKANEVANLDGNQALKKLIEGNNRFVGSKLLHPDQDLERKVELTKGQHPFAVVLGCSDSRVPPEILFDQGLGDLFVIREAGNVLDDDALGSIEYAVEHLGVRLVIVLGHENCGAVTAAVKGASEHNHIQCLLDQIKPAVDQAKAEKGDLLNNSIKDHIKLVTNKLKHSEPIVSEFLKENKLTVVGAYYNLKSGKVDIVNP